MKSILKVLEMKLSYYSIYRNFSKSNALQTALPKNFLNENLSFDKMNNSCKIYSVLAKLGLARMGHDR